MEQSENVEAAVAEEVEIAEEPTMVAEVVAEVGPQLPLCLSQNFSYTCQQNLQKLESDFCWLESAFIGQTRIFFSSFSAVSTPIFASKYALEYALDHIAIPTVVTASSQERERKNERSQRIDFL